MKIADLDVIFKVDFNEIRKYKKDLPAVWGNIVSDDLVEICFKNLCTFLPDCERVSVHFASRVKAAMSLAFDRINKSGDVNYPLFDDFLTSALMLLVQKDIQNIFDEKILLILRKFTFAGEVFLDQ